MHGCINEAFDTATCTLHMWVLSCSSKTHAEAHTEAHLEANAEAHPEGNTKGNTEGNTQADTEANSEAHPKAHSQGPCCWCACLPHQTACAFCPLCS